MKAASDSRQLRGQRPSKARLTQSNGTPMEDKELTFSEALLASLKQQRSTLLGNGQKPLCDVILRCGGIATQAHSSVLASVSKYFERILTDRQSTAHQVSTNAGFERNGTFKWRKWKF